MVKHFQGNRSLVWSPAAYLSAPDLMLVNFYLLPQVKTALKTTRFQDVTIIK